MLQLDRQGQSGALTEQQHCHTQHDRDPLKYFHLLSITLSANRLEPSSMMAAFLRSLYSALKVARSRLSPVLMWRSITRRLATSGLQLMNHFSSKSGASLDQGSTPYSRV